VEFVVGDVGRLKLGIANFDANFIGVRIQFAFFRQARLCFGRRNQVDDYLMADKRCAAPIAGNE